MPDLHLLDHLEPAVDLNVDPVLQRIPEADVDTDGASEVDREALVLGANGFADRIIQSSFSLLLMAAARLYQSGSPPPGLTRR